MEISGYDLIRCDHPSNKENFIPLRVSDMIPLDECVNFKLKIGDKHRRFDALYRSPSQTQDDFLSFLQ